MSLQQYGGVPTHVNGEIEWNFGWIPPHRRTRAQSEAAYAAIEAMPKFEIVGKTDYGPEKKVMLTNLWKHPDVIATLGWPFTGTHQLTGSCFVAGTQVRMADGSEKSIEDIRVGDVVFSHTGDKRAVVQTFYRLYNGALHTFRVQGWNRTVTMTADHDCLVVTNTEYAKCKAADVRVGDRFLVAGHREDCGMRLTTCGPCSPVSRIDTNNVSDFPVYCCEVEVDHTLVANGIACGQCVGAGGGNALFTLIAGDAVLRNEPERIHVPFWLLPYGRSRFYMGDRSPGEGSTGGTFAKAVKEDGTLDASLPGFPSFTRDDGFVWGADVERSWSDGDAEQTLKLLPESKKHIVQTTAQCKSADDVREAICNGYPVTIASSWGGGMKCPTEGNPPVLLNKRQGSWSHQMSVQNWQIHPELGELFWIQNQWGDAHGHDPAGGPFGGFWVKKNEIEWICTSGGGEVFAFSQYQGYPSQVIPWVF